MINPNSDKDFVNKYPFETKENQINQYPLFFKKIYFQRFRNISNLEVEFKSPITVIAGSNKSGKTSILLAIACSHYNFQKKDYLTGNFERTRWGKVMKFTNCDIQQEDWTYYVSYREGAHDNDDKRGQRKFQTKKWNGVAKKESQIGTPRNQEPGGRNVFLIDLERIVPARQSDALFKKAKHSSQISFNDDISRYLSYILEENYQVSQICSAANGIAYKYNNNVQYSSFNTASGEDALTHILQGITEAPEKSLILIEEIEIGLHPKIQRRLIDILYHESRKKHKQFIITTHSPAILTSVAPCSRIFIERNNQEYRSIYNISASAALSKMDSKAYPLVNIYVEDEVSKQLTNKAVAAINQERKGFQDLVKIIPVGPAEKTYTYFSLRKSLYDKEDSNRGYACILDGDMKGKKNKADQLMYPEEKLLFFHFSSLPPEKMLVNEYLKNNNDETINYHYEHGNPHALFDKMIEQNIVVTRDEAFNLCFSALLNTEDGIKHFEALKEFLINCVTEFSPDL